MCIQGHVCEDVCVHVCGGFSDFLLIPTSLLCSSVASGGTRTQKYLLLSRLLLLHEKE